MANVLIDNQTEIDTLENVTVITDDTNPPVAKPPANPKLVAAFFAMSLVAVVAGGHMRVFLAVLAFAGMIFLHELGHFLAARATGTKATEFFVGFGPKVWSFTRGETEYGLKAIPVGGYVKILGMHNLEKVDPADEPRTYRQKSFPRRVLMAAAGTLTHLLIAFVCFTVLFSGTGNLIDTDAVRVVEIAPTIDGKPGPAAQAGLQLGETIAFINDERMRSNQEIAQTVNANAGIPLKFSLFKDGNFTRDLTITPVATITERGTIGRIGIATDSTQVVRHGVIGGMGESLKKMGSLAPMTYKSLASFFTPKNLKDYSEQLVDAGSAPKEAVATPSTNRFLSPPAAVNLLADASKTDIRWAIEIYATLNVFVGVFNMLPLMPLDGGHVLLAIYERLRSRKNRMYHANIAKLMPLTYAVMAIMLLLGVTSLYLDLRSPLKVF